jgi:Fe-S-cluster containining protein
MFSRGYRHPDPKPAIRSDFPPAAEIPDAMECLQCGWCCRQYRGYHWAKAPDLLRWHREGKQDILRFVAAGRNPDGTPRSAADLGEADLAALEPATGWTDPGTGLSLEACPFLTDAGDGRFLCAIHLTKPAVCRETNTWEWGSGRFGPWGCPVSPP